MKKYLIGLVFVLFGAWAMMHLSQAMYLVDSPHYDYFIANKSWFAYVDYSNSSRLVYPGNFFMPYNDIVFTEEWASKTIYHTMSSWSIYFACRQGYPHSPCERGAKEYSWDFEHHFTVLSWWYVLNKHTLFTKDVVLITTWFYLGIGSLRVMNDNIAYIDWVLYQSGKRMGKSSNHKIKIIDDRFYRVNGVIYSRYNTPLDADIVDAKTFRVKSKKEYDNWIILRKYYQDKKNIYILKVQVWPDMYKETIDVYDRKTRSLTDIMYISNDVIIH